MTLVQTQTIRPNIAVARLANPDRLNVLSKLLIHELNSSLDNLEKNDAIKCIIITGTGTVFSGGADLKELQTASLDGKIENDFIEPWQRLSLITKPVIAAVNGYALGGGLELALMADLIIASKEARFGQPEIKLSLLPGGGGTQRLTRLIGKAKTMELCLTGESISAEEALRWGLVNSVTEANDLMPAALKMAEKIAARSLLVLKMIKKAITDGAEMPLNEGLKMERELFWRACKEGSYKEAISAFLNRR
ncbi:MAG: enoyl-CoA hydratase/isomerase family protein [Alphaproteobacteria bacterium]|nr:enoyl-CoA hydratase/isomerase family protein [Alphaproteobacteria bacterium]